MSDKNSSSKPPIQLPGKQPDPGMERRLMLAFGLMGLVLLGTNYLMPPPPPDASKKGAAAQKQASATTPAAPKATPASAPPAGKTPAASVAASAEETYTIETDLYKIVFSNRGAVVKSWVLKKFTDDSRKKQLDLVNPVAGKLDAPFSVRFHSDQPADAVNSALFVGKLSADKQGIEFEYSGGEWSARKSFQFDRNSYLSKFSSEVRNSGVAKPHLLYWRGGFGDSSVIGAAASQLTVRYDLGANSFKSLGPSDASDAFQAHRGRFTFAGITDSYFAAVALPDTNKDFEIHTLADQLENQRDKKLEWNVGAAIGGNAINDFQLFVGPKDTRLLSSISPRLENLVDFGYFAILAKPLFLALRYLNDNITRNWGWAIVLITVIINFLLLPLKISSLKSMKLMGALQPQVMAIKKKYEGLSLTDPRKQEENREVMDLYSKHGASPMGGCVPMMLQIPFFIAFYNVLAHAIELRGADWLWVTDLSRPETLALRVLPIAMVITQFIQQKMTPATTPDPAQQRVMLMMPAFMGFMFYGMSSGLVLYWLTGNVVGIAQQWVFNRMFANPTPVTTPAASGAAQAKKKK